MGGIVALPELEGEGGSDQFAGQVEVEAGSGQGQGSAGGMRGKWLQHFLWPGVA